MADEIIPTAEERQAAWDADNKVDDAGAPLSLAEQRRLEALRLASETHGAPADVVDRARAYLKFLEGAEAK